ncbi:MAG TPA: response regulator [Alphaproteobacteria bacterium]
MRSYDFSRLRTLVVDDDRHMRAIYTKILSGFGIRTILDVADAINGLDALAAFRPDFAIIDYELPGMDGIEFLRTVRTSPASLEPCMPILFITGYADAGIVRRARDAGANEIMRKPITVPDLYARLAAMIERPRPFVRAPGYVGPCRRRHANIGYAGVERRAGETEFRRNLAQRMNEVAFGGRGRR